MDLNQFAEEIKQEVLSQCSDEEEGDFRENKFTEIMIDYLKEANEIDDGDICYHKSHGMKLNGFNYSEDGEAIDLLVCSYSGTAPPVSISKTDVTRHYDWLKTFLARSVKGLHKTLEEASTTFDVAKYIHDHKNDLAKVNFYMLTDGIAKNVEYSGSSSDGIEIQYYLWDIDKLHRFVSSGMKREAIEIDFEKQFGCAVQCIGKTDIADEYDAYLAFFSGEQLADLYSEYGARLLEKNVRTYLQARGKVNKGIRDTIRNEPHRFLAYNNGISATAESIEVSRNNGIYALKRAKDFQIVNGAQTTASIYHAVKKDKADVSDLFVQVKLTVLKSQDIMEEFVPCISRFANSQNAVKTTDFSANDAYHREMEELSRTIWAPAQSGTERQTHWYYERARGQYLDDKGRQGTPSRMRAFEALNPKSQMFTKTDHAKYENTWMQMPHCVALGAEKNFREYMILLKEKGSPIINEEYFRRVVAKTLLFKTAEKIVSGQRYGGFRAQIVTYTLAWLSHHTAQRIDLDSIWKKQTISENLKDAILKISKQAYEHIVNTPTDKKNPSEWCKKAECWEKFKEREIRMSADLERELISERRKDEFMYLKEDKKGFVVSGPEDEKIIAAVIKVPADIWFKIAKWAKETNNLKGYQRSMAVNIGKALKRGGAPSIKLAQQGVKIYSEAGRLGFVHKA